jgi:hypothetical protein
LEAGDVDAVAIYAPSRVQYIDVGVYGSAPLSGGQFQISYGKYKTGCIDYNSEASVAKRSMTRRLEEIPEVAVIGIT